ncbi:MAG: pyruvate/2-oxoglutarate dehydrogenase complex dihydrolipoamide acyltransferase (E2) component [Porticoccaceae bacterium]|jgi:pyruvate/2-oxoglutarate dehydrogenase complex dihydrolipoamide acyltransferase (E2) component|tara:strand:+ start:2496 stop:2729 length:234 start_codon:yes stop_codon:yes gene_type:complete
MTIEIVVPQLGNEITEAEVTAWELVEGDSVKKGDFLLTITTTKMAIEIEAPESGILTKILVQEGELVDVGAKLGEID